ncbi:hypothetical protein EYV94_25395 [Puteibacter caeruleilacunae]|nr:hypothetical protein EYV94_25395 [Puteibacter caeruleilacunae]
MIKRNKIWSLLLCCLTMMMTGCQDEYYFDGGLAKPELKISTYDFIASRDEFSMAKFIIDKGNLKEVINKNGNTVFIPRNDNVKGLIAQKAWGDMQFEHFPAERMDVFVEAMKRYIYESTLRWEDGPSLGKKEVTCINGDALSIYKVQTAYKGVQRAGAQYLYLEREIVDPKTQEVTLRSGRINTSNLLSTNGTVHVMDYSHTFGFE